MPLLFAASLVESIMNVRVVNLKPMEQMLGDLLAKFILAALATGP